MRTKNFNEADFEKAFDDFINRREYDNVENALFSMIRVSFNAGWMAAGGNPAKAQDAIAPPRKPFEVIQLGDYIETDTYN